MALTPAEKQRLYRERKRSAPASGSAQVDLNLPVLDLSPLEEVGPLQDCPEADERSLLDSVFIDWLSIYQVFPPGVLPVLGTEIVISTNLQTGEKVSERVTGFQHEGSFDTRIHVKSDGTFLFVSGNPSAYDRLDNLFGVRSVVHAVKVYNAVLRGLGLPEFTLPDANPSHPKVWVKWNSNPTDGALGFFTSGGGRQSQFSDSMIKDGRPRITAIHLTVNLSTSDAVGFLRQISGFVYKGKPGYLYPNGRSVDWPQAKGLQRKYSRRIYHKYYDKAYELECKLSALYLQKKKDPLNFVLHSRITYLEKLLEWSRLHGIVRREVEIKSTELISRGLIHIKDWSSEVMANVVYPYQFHNKLRTENTRLDNVYDHFIALEYSKPVSSKAAMLHRCWVNGDDVRQLAGSRQTFERYRNLLLSVGVDIAQQCDISRLVLRAERFSWSHISPPDWYKNPGDSLQDVIGI